MSVAETPQVRCCILLSSLSSAFFISGVHMLFCVSPSISLSVAVREKPPGALCILLSSLSMLSLFSGVHMLFCVSPSISLMSVAVGEKPHRCAAAFFSRRFRCFLYFRAFTCCFVLAPSFPLLAVDQPIPAISPLSLHYQLMMWWKCDQFMLHITSRRLLLLSMNTRIIIINYSYDRYYYFIILLYIYNYKY